MITMPSMWDWVRTREEWDALPLWKRLATKLLNKIADKCDALMMKMDTYF